MEQKSFIVVGMMSGTSLDGLDMACCRFWKNDKGWSYELLAAATLPYDSLWQQKLSNAWQQSAESLEHLDLEYGNYLGSQAKQFIDSLDFELDLIASHGHTVFHQPERGITLQIGNGAAIAKKSGLTTICNFRQEDVKKGGQGAPLVPIGDELLFSKFPFCLNIGGIANISFREGEKRIAFDICPANQVLNYLSGLLGMPYDNGGAIAASGKLIPELLSSLKALDYYQQTYPKSLGREWVEEEVFPLLKPFLAQPENCLHTFCIHIAEQIHNAVDSNSLGSILVTGGGAHNAFLIQKLREKMPNDIFVPDKQLVDYKEAIVFAFLGVLRLNDEINCLASVTGAFEDSSTGDIFNVKPSKHTK